MGAMARAVSGLVDMASRTVQKSEQLQARGGGDDLEQWKQRVEATLQMQHQHLLEQCRGGYYAPQPASLHIRHATGHRDSAGANIADQTGQASGTKDQSDETAPYSAEPPFWQFFVLHQTQRDGKLWR